MTRRNFLPIAAAPLWGRALAAAGPAPVKDAIEHQATAFPLAQVRLLGQPYLQLMERNRAYLHDLEADRLLHTFRITAGLPSTAEPLGGWEKPDVELRGHFTGHFLSACALMYSGSGDADLKAKGGAIVAELAKCQKANGGGYLSAYPAEFFDRLQEGKRRVWAPWYTIHKILAGLLDMHVLCGNEQALEVVQGMAGWTGKWTGQLSEDHLARVLEVEFGGMNEVLNNLYAVTGNGAYLTTAHRFDHKRIFDPLAEGRDELKGLHVNTQIPKIIGAARRYELTGEKRYRDIAEFFWRTVTERRSYCTGGTSNREHWRSDPGKLAGELGPTTQECCCTYNMLKLTRHLFSWAPEPAYADYYERAMLNGILGTMNPEDGMTMYYVPLASGYYKVFSRPRDSFWCCTGTGIESFSKLADSIYFHDDQSLWVNLFIASELNWAEKGLRLRQQTRFPQQEGTSLTFEAKRPTRLALHVRVPYWATRGASVRVNGKPVTGPSGPRSYLTLNRTWKSGDTVEVSMPMSLHVHPMPDDETLQAMMYGPLVLAGLLGAEPVPKELMYNRGQRPQPAPAPEFVTESSDPGAWIKPAPEHPLSFRTAGQAQDVTLVPLNEVVDRRYGVYWRVSRKG